MFNKRTGVRKMKTKLITICAVVGMILAISGVASADLIITYTQTAEGVTGLCTGTAAYTSPSTAGNSGYADVGPNGNFGFGGELTVWKDWVAWRGTYSPGLYTFVDAPDWTDPTSVSGTFFYFTVERFTTDFGITQGDSVSGSIFFAGLTLSDLGIAEVSNQTFTFTPYDESLDALDITFSSSTVPEPATMALLGLGGLLIRRKRRA